MYKIYIKTEETVRAECSEWNTFEEAKIQFRNIVREKLRDRIGIFTTQIDDYCSEFYPHGAYEEFAQLKEILTKFATDPKFPQKIEDINLEDFEDENVEFYISWCNNICAHVRREVEAKFPSIEINIVEMDDPYDEYYFFISDNRSSNDKQHYLIDVTLSCMEDDNNRNNM